MVGQSIYPPPDSRRYGTPHRAPYPHPYMPADHRHRTDSPFESQRNMSSEDVSGQRKRIPVACGRCRKRKIRCSGDTGDGSCSNCRNAGVVPCLFLRVASHEAPIKSDGFNYNLADSRTHHARGLTAVSTTHPLPATYPDGVCAPATVDALPYRSSHAYAYGSGPGGRTPLPWGSAYYDTVSEHPDQGYPTHSLYIPTYPPSESRYTTSYHPPPAKPLPSYIDSEPTACSFGSGSYGTTTLAHRPAPSAADASSGPWFHGIPGSSTGDKTTTAMPSIDRPPLQQSQSYVRNDSISSAPYSKSSSSPTGSLPEMTPTSSYGTTSYESSPVSGYPVAGSSSSQQPRSGDMYTTSSSSSSAAANVSSTSLDFPPAPVSKYVYQDTTAAAGVGLARHRANVSPGYGHPAYDLTQVPEDRKDTVSLRS